MREETLYPRFLRPRIEEALADSPVVMIHGPRQCGKTTLARLVEDEAGFPYFTFDDDVQRAAAQADPVGYVADLPERAVLDEIQRVPELFTSFKAVVDARLGPSTFRKRVVAERFCVGLLQWLERPLPGGEQGPFG